VADSNCRREIYSEPCLEVVIAIGSRERLSAGQLVISGKSLHTYTIYLPSLRPVRTLPFTRLLHCITYQNHIDYLYSFDS